LAALLQQFPEVRHIKIEDGKGKPLGRSFRVKLWPNLVFLRDGKVLRQLARPEPRQVWEGLEAISGRPEVV
jgi:thioredoxin 1